MAISILFSMWGFPLNRCIFLSRGPKGKDCSIWGIYRSPALYGNCPMYASVVFMGLNSKHPKP